MRSAARLQSVQSHVYRMGQLQRGFFQIGIGRNEGRRQQHVIAGFAVNRAAHRVTNQTRFKRRLLDLGVQLFLRRERRLCLAICDQLHPLEETNTANVTHMRVLTQMVMQH